MDFLNELFFRRGELRLILVLRDSNNTTMNEARWKEKDRCNQRQ